MADARVRFAAKGTFMNRRDLLGLAAGAGAALAARPAGAQQLTTIRVGTFVSESTGAVFYAQDQGFFAKHGLTMQFIPAPGGAAVGSAMAAGDVDIGEGDPLTVAIGRDKGLPFVIIAAGELQTSVKPTFGIVVRDPAVKLGRDFNGKTMASNVAHGFGSLVTQAWVDNNGGDSKSIKWVEMPFPALAAALQRGLIDGYIAPEPFVTAGVKQGGTVVTLDRKPVAPVMLQGAWFTTSTWLAKNQATARAFASAVAEAGAWANQNPHGAAEIIAKYSKIPLAVIESSTMRGNYALHLEAGMIAPLVAAGLKYGYLSKPVPMSELIATL